MGTRHPRVDAYIARQQDFAKPLLTHIAMPKKKVAKTETAVPAELTAEETRARRVAQAVEWIADGKSRNWKYQES